MSDAALRRRRLGTDAMLPAERVLRAGPIEATLIEGGLRTIRYDGIEIIRAIAYVVRDPDWGTYAPVLSELQVNEQLEFFAVTYHATCRDPENGQTLHYEAHIEGSTQDGLSFTVSATPQGDFTTARCGFAVLHPLQGTVGRRARVEHGDQSIEDAIFPELIAPWQPFKDIVSILHEPVDGLDVTCRFDGDVFEMEDQRAWSDASFKTYVRPLALPWPYTLAGGERSTQRVTLTVSNMRGARSTTSSPRPVTISPGEPSGAFPRIGLTIQSPEIDTALAHPRLLHEIAPQQLLFHFDPTAGDGLATLAGFAAIAAALPQAEIGLEVAVACRAPLDQEMRELAAIVAESGLRLDTLMVSPSVDRQSTPPGSTWPQCPPLESVYEAARAAFPQTRLGGGMLAYFTELNRKRPPLDGVDFVSHCTCPIVHAADDLSVMQSLDALPHILRSTRAIIGNTPYRIGPSTIGMRQNPYGSRVIPNPDGIRMPMTDRDPRQRGLFAAAWTAGYVAALAEANLEAFVPAHLAGSLGLVEVSADGMHRHPIFHVVAALARLGGRTRLICPSDPEARVAAFAGDGPSGTELWIANLTEAPQQVTIAAKVQATILTLDDTGTHDGETGGAKASEPSLTLGPYAVIGLRLA